MQKIVLNTTPQIEIDKGGVTKAYTLKVDSADDVFEVQMKANAIVALLQSASKGEDVSKPLMDGVVEWVGAVLGGEAYNEIFPDETSRNNYPWHEAIFWGATNAIAKSRENLMQSFADSPVIREMKKQAGN